MKGVIIILLLVVASTKSFAQKQSSYVDTALTAMFDRFNNKAFAELQLEDTSGTLFNTATLLGKTIYVDFWFTTCPPCMKEIPFSQLLQQFFAADTNIVILNICIENIERKQAWKQMIQNKQMQGIHLFYARNRPQKINLLREYDVTFPIYLLINKQMKIVGYNAPRPSEKGFVHWAIKQAEQGVLLSDAYRQLAERSKEYVNFIEENRAAITTFEYNAP